MQLCGDSSGGERLVPSASRTREDDRRAASELRDEGGWTAVSNDLAVVQDCDVVRELLRLVEIVRREENRPPLPLEVSNQRPELPPRAGIEARRRLVEEQEFGLADEGHRDAEAPLLAAGKV